MAPHVDWILCAAGLALCLFGWTIYWGGLHLAGGAVGAGAAVTVVMKAMEISAVVANEPLVLALSAVVGFALGVFFFRQLHFLVVGLVGAALGLVVGAQIATTRAAEPAQAATLLYGLIGAAGGALLFIVLHRHVVILIASAAGAVLLGQGFMPDNPLPISLVAFPVACILQLGVVRRLGLNAPSRESGEPPES